MFCTYLSVSKLYPHDYAPPLETDAREAHNLMRRAIQKGELIIFGFLTEQGEYL